MNKNISSHIFTPENKLKTNYLHLKRIIESKNYDVIIDYYFVAELFSEEVTKRLNNYSFKRPVNYYQLSLYNQIQIFISECGNQEWKELIIKLIQNDNLVKKYNYQHVFPKFIDALKQYDLCLDGSYYPNKSTLVVIAKNNLSNFNFNHIVFQIALYSDIQEFKNDIIKYLFLLKSSDIKLVFKNLISDIKPELKDSDLNQGKYSNYLDFIEIKHYFNLDNIIIEQINDCKEIYFLGENGYGKTLILQAILLGIYQDFIKEKANKAEVGQILQLIDDSKTTTESIICQDIEEKFDEFVPIFAYGVHRTRYAENKSETYGFLTLFDNKPKHYIKNPEDWFKDLYIKKLEQNNDEVINKATQIFSELFDNQIKIAVTQGGKTEFTLNNITVPFDKLSTGYKTVFMWIADLVIRLSEKFPDADSTTDYKAIVLVDEIGLYLHPKLEYSLVKKLRNLFPKIQWFFTTHSPISVLGASKDAVFYKLTQSKKKTKFCVEKVDIDIQNVNPNIILTSPLFETTTVPMSNEEFGKYATAPDWTKYKTEQLVTEVLKGNNEVISVLKNYLND